MCIRHTGTPAAATTSAIAGSWRRAVTSLTSAAPARMARSATSAFTVSIETGTSVPRTSPSITGSTRSSSTSSGTGSDPGRVDSPPTSSTSAPSAASSRPWAIASAGSRNAPPSENESGVTFTTPMTAGAGNLSRSGSTLRSLERPGRLAVRERRRLGDLALPAGRERPGAATRHVQLGGRVVVESDRVGRAELDEHLAPVPAGDAVAVADAARDDQPAAGRRLGHGGPPVRVVPLPAVVRHHRGVDPRRRVRHLPALHEARLAAHDVRDAGPARGVRGDREGMGVRVGPLHEAGLGEVPGLRDQERLAGRERDVDLAVADVAAARGGVQDLELRRGGHAGALAEAEGADGLAGLQAGRVGDLLVAPKHRVEEIGARVRDDDPDPAGGHA